MLQNNNVARFEIRQEAGRTFCKTIENMGCFEALQYLCKLWAHHEAVNMKIKSLKYSVKFKSEWE